MTKIIDNTKETLKDVLNRELEEVSEIAIATAYFNISGFGDIEEGLDDKPLRLLLGRPPEESIKWEDEILRELEEYEDDPQYFRLLQRAISFFESPSREVRIVEGRFFHGKAFVGAHPSLKEVRRGFAVVGSSNFTHGGLVANRELNMFTTDREAVQELADWFERQWSDDMSRDYKEEFLSKLKTYVTSWSPYEVVAKALWETYKKDIEKWEKSALETLYPHQRLSFVSALEKLEKYGGVIIADSIGLGKTKTALALIHEYRRKGTKALLIAPKSILDTTWSNEMRDADIHVEHVNMEMLSADPSVVERYLQDNYKPGLVVIDEAHYFRHPNTNRYEALSHLLTATGAKVVLITATPVNTSLMDLYHLLALYLPDDVIYSEYKMGLKSYFVECQKKWLNKEPIDMDDLLRMFVVRHSRELAKAISNLKFPDRVLRTISYDLGIDVSKLYEVLERLNFAYYELAIERLSGEFRLPDGTLIPEYKEGEKIEKFKELVKIVQRINFLKRLESSSEAFKKSVERLKKYIEYANKYARERSVFIPPRLKGDLFRLLDNEEPGHLPKVEEVFSKKPELLEKCRLSEEEVRVFVQRNEEDLKLLDEALSMLPNRDPKIQSLLQVLEEIYPTLKDRNGVIIFTVYADTARYLYQSLRQKGFDRLIIVTGEGGEKASGERLEEAKAVNEFTKHGGVMISTDVLSAGQNLQNAQYVVNYDFPWNPVILIQRAGRVDRIGSHYDKIYLYNVLPSRGSPDDPTTLEHFLNLMTRLYERLEAIRETVGIDASTLGEEAAPKDFSDQFRIADGDKTILEELEKRIEQFTRDPLDDLARIINEQGLDWVKQLPNGIGAIKRGERSGVFALFKDDENEEYYWRLKWLDSGETIGNPTEITSTLLSGEVHNKGDIINYDQLIDKLKQLKEELIKELEKRRSIDITIGDTPIHTNKLVRIIYDALEKSGEYELAVRFRKASNDPLVVRLLKKALDEGRLVEVARKLLSSGIKESRSTEHKPLKLKRICWCIITPR